MARQIIERLEGADLETLHGSVRKALGIALALGERVGGGDDHDKFAAQAIGDLLTEAREILEVEGPPHGE